MANIYISNYSGTSTAFSIPTAISNSTRTINRITTIASGTFANNTSLTSIEGSSILEIETSAFYKCSALTSISFPNCKYIGMSAFAASYYGSKMIIPSISFPECSYIGRDAFYNCASLSTISLPKCNYIGDSAFYNTVFQKNLFSTSAVARLVNSLNNFILLASAYKLTGLYIDNSATFICESAFFSCYRLTSAAFPNCTYIDTQAFLFCRALTSVSFPNCSYIGGGAFYYTSFLTNLFLSSTLAILSNSYLTFLLEASNDNVRRSIERSDITFICNTAFYDCSKIQSLSFINCTYIGKRAFYSCTELKSILLPKCGYIDLYAFDSCLLLTELSFPNCSIVGDYAFNNCYSLTQAHFLSTSYITGGISMFNNCSMLESIYVPLSMVNNYKSMRYWSNYSSKILGYIAPEKTIGEKPTNLNPVAIWSGLEINNGYSGHSNLIVMGADKGTNPGSYTATYIPKVDCYWEDRTNAAVEVSLTILYMWAKWSFDSAKNIIATSTTYYPAPFIIKTCEEEEYYYDTEYYTAISVDDNKNVTLSNTTRRSGFATQNNAWDYVFELYDLANPHYVGETSTDKYTTGHRLSSIPFNTTLPMYWYNGNAYIGQLIESQGTIHYGFVSSLVSNTYPDNGPQDGYWYVKMLPIYKPTNLNPTVPYTGSEITNGYACPDHIVMTNHDRGTAVGTYTATYTPETGYCWSDGTTTPVNVVLSIVSVWTKWDIELQRNIVTTSTTYYPAPPIEEEYFEEEYSFYMVYASTEMSIDADMNIILPPAYQISSGDDWNYLWDTLYELGTYYIEDVDTSRYSSVSYFDDEQGLTRQIQFSTEHPMYWYNGNTYIGLETALQGLTLYGTVFSTDINAYPNNGEQGGYWYVKIVGNN